MEWPWKKAVCGVPKTTPRFNGLGLSKELYPWLKFITAKGHKAKAAKGTGTQQSGGNRHKLQGSSPRGVTQDMLRSSSTESDNTRAVSSSREAH